jgi:hypothetical protein
MLNCLDKIKSWVHYIIVAVEINSFFYKNRWLKKIVKNKEKKENDKILFFPTGNKYLIFIYGLLGVFFYKKKNIFFSLNNLNNYENIFFKRLGFKGNNILSIPRVSEEDTDKYIGLSRKIIKSFLLKNLIKVKYKKINCIRHVLSSMMRKGNISQLHFEKLEDKKKLIYETAKSMYLIDFAFDFFKKHKFKKIFISEKGYSPYAEFYNVAIELNIDVINIYPSQYADKLMIKRFDKKNIFEHFFTLDTRSWEEIKNIKNKKKINIKKIITESYNKNLWLKRKKTQENKKIYNKKELIQKLNLNKNFPTIIIFSHILFDATFWYGKNIFNDYSDWLIQTLKKINKINNVNWVVKMHPDNFWKIKNYNLQNYEEHQIVKKNIKKLSSNISLIYPDSDICSSSFFKIANSIITVRGTVGLEYPCFGIPVLTAGTGRYNNKGFTIDPKNKEEYFKKLKNLPNIKPLSQKKITLAQKFATQVFEKKPYKINCLYFHNKKNNHISDSFYQFSTLKSKKNFYSDRSMKKLYNWIFKSNKIDLLNF